MLRGHTLANIIEMFQNAYHVQLPSVEAYSKLFQTSKWSVFGYAINDFKLLTV